MPDSRRLLYLEPEQFNVEPFVEHIEPQAKEQSARYALKALYTQMLRVNSIALIEYTWGNVGAVDVGRLSFGCGYDCDALY